MTIIITLEKRFDANDHALCEYMHARKCHFCGKNTCSVLQRRTWGGGGGGFVVRLNPLFAGTNISSNIVTAI